MIHIALQHGLQTMGSRDLSPTEIDQGVELRESGVPWERIREQLHFMGSENYLRRQITPALNKRGAHGAKD